VALAGAGFVVRRIDGPRALGSGVADPLTGRVYWVAREAIAVQDGSTGKFVTQVPVTQPCGITLDATRNRAFVRPCGEPGLRVLDLVSLEFVASILEEDPVVGVTVSAPSGHVYVRVRLASGEDAIKIVDSDSLELLDAVSVGTDRLVAMALDGLRDRLFLLSSDSAGVSELGVLSGPGAPVITTNLVGTTFDLDVNARTGNAYVVGRSSVGYSYDYDCLEQVVDGATATPISSQVIPLEPSETCTAIAVDPLTDARFLWSQASYSYDTKLARVDGVTGDVIQRKAGARTVGFDPARSQITFASYSSYPGSYPGSDLDLVVIDMRSLETVESIPIVDPEPGYRLQGVDGVAFDPVAHRFLASYDVAFGYYPPFLMKSRIAIADGPQPIDIKVLDGPSGDDTGEANETNRR
jgi:hypothetical protein